MTSEQLIERLNTIRDLSLDWKTLKEAYEAGRSTAYGTEMKDHPGVGYYQIAYKMGMEHSGEYDGRYFDNLKDKIQITIIKHELSALVNELIHQV